MTKGVFTSGFDRHHPPVGQQLLSPLGLLHQSDVRLYRDSLRILPDSASGGPDRELATFRWENPLCVADIEIPGIGFLIGSHIVLAQLTPASARRYRPDRIGFPDLDLADLDLDLIQFRYCQFRFRSVLI